MTLFFGGPHAANSFMDDYEIIPPAPPVPIPDPAQYLVEDEDTELMFIASIGFKLAPSGSSTITTSVPRTTDASGNTVSRSRYTEVQIDVELSAAGTIEVYWDAETTKKVYIITGRRQIMQVPNAATGISCVCPGAGTVTLTFGRVE